MTTTMPDRLAIDPKSPFYNKALLDRGVGVRFKGAEKQNVVEYCVSEGWVRLGVGATTELRGPKSRVLVGAGVKRGRDGQRLAVKLQGAVEVWMRDEVQP